MKNILRENLGQQPTYYTLGGTPLGTTAPSYATTTTFPTNPPSSIQSQVVQQTAPTIMHEKVEKPVIVKERLFPQETVELQPVIHREREQLEVHEIVQPLHERDICPTTVKRANLPAQIRPDIRESDSQYQAKYKEATGRYVSEIKTEPIQREFVNKPAVVEEHISKKILEEIQPVLYKETVTPVIIQQTQPIYEKVIEAPVIIEEVRQAMEIGGNYPAYTTAETIKAPMQRELIVTKEVRAPVYEHVPKTSI